MATPASTGAAKPIAVSPSTSTAIATPASPSVVLSQTSMVSPTEQGWKITIKNSDGTSNEVVLEPKVSEHAMTDDPEKAKADEEPAKVGIPPSITPSHNTTLTLPSPQPHCASISSSSTF
jgi:hypothetical protein